MDNVGKMLCQCATYPFHGNHLVSKFDWNAEAAKCEGIVPVDHSQPLNELRSDLQGTNLKLYMQILNCIMVFINSAL